MVMASKFHKTYGQFILKLVLLEARLMRTLKEASLMALAAIYLVSMRIDTSRIHVDIIRPENS